MYRYMCTIFMENSASFKNQLPMISCYLQFHSVVVSVPVPVAAWSKAWVHGRSPTEIVGSNPTRGKEVCML